MFTCINHRVLTWSVYWERMMSETLILNLFATKKEMGEKMITCQMHSAASPLHALQNVDHHMDKYIKSKVLIFSDAVKVFVFNYDQLKHLIQIFFFGQNTAHHDITVFSGTAGNLHFCPHLPRKSSLSMSLSYSSTCTTCSG